MDPFGLIDASFDTFKQVMDQGMDTVEQATSMINPTDCLNTSSSKQTKKDVTNYSFLTINVNK